MSRAAITTYKAPIFVFFRELALQVLSRERIVFVWTRWLPSCLNLNYMDSSFVSALPPEPITPFSDSLPSHCVLNPHPHRMEH